jgi:hypothetical protein
MERRMTEPTLLVQICQDGVPRNFPYCGSVEEAEFTCQAKGLIVLRIYASTSSISTS